MPEPSAEKNSSDVLWLLAGRIRELIHTFPKDTCPKANVIAQLEFELRLLQFRSPVLKPLHHEDTPPVILQILYFST